MPMPMPMIAREFPSFDEQVEASILHFTDLSIACECAVRGIPGSTDALSRVIDKHRTSLAAVAAPPQTHGGAILISSALQSVWLAVGEILQYERRVEASHRPYVGHHDMRAREEADKAAIEAFLAENALRIHREISNRVVPVVAQLAKAALPAVSLAAPIYFMARAVLWIVSPEFARKHEASLQRESESYADRERAQEWAEAGLRPDLFLDLKPSNPEAPTGYVPSSPHLALALAGLKPPEHEKASHPPSPNVWISMLSDTLKCIRDLLSPAKRTRQHAAGSRLAPPGLFGHLVDR